MQLYHTFISYSRADDEFALKLANDLRAAGVNIWLDQIDIPPGARWDRAVETALETCGRLLVILSPTSAGSENVQDEIGVAFDNHKPIVPILCQPCEVPMRLRRLQHIDFTKEYEHGLQTLLTLLKLPIAVPDDGMASQAATVPSGGGQARAESKPSYQTQSASVAEPARGLMNRRNVFIGLAALAVLAVLLWSVGGGSSDDSGADAGEAAATESEGTVSAFGTLANIKIVNNSDWEIHEMYMKASKDSDWGPERLGSDAVISAQGGQHTLTQIPCERYDVKLVDEDSDECEIPEQNVCGEHETWIITSDDLLACQNRQ